MKGKPRRYTVRQIVAWADMHYAMTGQWPNSRSGPIAGADTTWEAVQSALIKGLCGLSGGDSLARVLARHRDVTHTRRRRPALNRKQILEWADAFHHRTGRWPRRDSGPVAEAPDISWHTVDRYLRCGGPALPGGSSLIQLLREARYTWDARGSRRLTSELILRWAKHHHDMTGRWPVTTSGPVIAKPGEVWANIDVAMRNGRRGFPTKTSLSRLLRQNFGEKYTSSVGKPLKKPIRKKIVFIGRASNNGDVSALVSEQQS